MYRKLLILFVCFSLAFVPTRSAYAVLGVGDIVFDPTNLAQNVLTAARTLEMINNQIKQLTNEAQMLVNQAKNLANLPFSVRAQIQARLNQIQALIQSAKGVAYNIAATQDYYATNYPDDYSAFTNQQMIVHARARWQAAKHAFNDALVMHAQISETVAQDAVILDELITQSQGAVGNLQAQQAGNQLLALTTKQSLQTQQLMATQYRAQALERSRTIAIEEAARVRLRRFIGDGNAYTP